MNYEKFKFPDEQDGNIKQDQDDAAVKADAQDDVEVEIVDDTPPKDRGRKPLDKEVSDPTDDEIENYSANVQARIKELTHARHDERRRKEELEREKQEMERLLQYMADENKKLKQSVNQGHEIVLSSATEAAEAQLSAARRQLKEAQESFDTDAIIAAQEALTDAKMRLDRVKNFKPAPLQEDEADKEIEALNSPKQSLLSKLVNLVSTGTANPRAKSEQDDVIDGIKFITRYSYDGAIKENSREFCKRMIAANKLYRKEDILRMSNQVVNEGWGPEGIDLYSIWLYKGGGSCHHAWRRKTFVAFDEKTGIDPTSPKAKTISTAKAEKAGYRIRNNNLVAMRPKDMPYEGFLPTNKRFN